MQLTRRRRRRTTTTTTTTTASSLIPGVSLRIKRGFWWFLKMWWGCGTFLRKRCFGKINFFQRWCSFLSREVLSFYFLVLWTRMGLINGSEVQKDNCFKQKTDPSWRSLIWRQLPWFQVNAKVRWWNITEIEDWKFLKAPSQIVARPWDTFPGVSFVLDARKPPTKSPSQIGPFPTRQIIKIQRTRLVSIVKLYLSLAGCQTRYLKQVLLFKNSTLRWVALSH